MEEVKIHFEMVNKPVQALCLYDQTCNAYESMQVDVSQPTCTSTVYMYTYMYMYMYIVHVSVSLYIVM